MPTYRSASALICAVWLLQLAGGILAIITPLGLDAMGLGTTAIGTIAALYGAGFMGGAAYAPRLISRIGNIKAFSVAAAFAGMGALALYLSPLPLAWLLIRILQGASFAIMFTATEAWLGTAVDSDKRGGVMGIFHVAAKAALFVGPLFIIGYSPLDPENYIWCGVFLAAALVPICMTNQKEPSHTKVKPLSLGKLINLAPAAATGVFFAGLINTGTLALLPIFASSFAPDGEQTRFAAYAFAAVNIGGLLMQWPAGRYSDRVDRRLVVGILALFAAVAAGAISFYIGQISMLLILGLMALWGAGSLSYYGICVAHAIDRAQPEQVTHLMSGLLFIWAAGSIAGPVLSGLAMRTELGPASLFSLSSFLLIILAIIMFVRKSWREPPIELAQEEWNPSFPTSISGVELDPRIPDA